MSRQERIAWFTVLVTISSVSAFALLIPILGLFRATGAFSILALIGLTPFFAWRGKRGGEVAFDERDRAINARAVRIGYSIFWLYFVAGAMSAYLYYGERGNIPVAMLPMFLWVGFAILYLAMSLATIILYRAGWSNAQE